MADIHVVDSEELQQFSTLLTELAHNMTENFAMANRAASFVNQGWHDRQNEIFMDKFAQATEAIDRISEVLKEHADYVRRYAEYIAGATSIR